MVKAQSVVTFLLTNHGTILTWYKANIVEGKLHQEGLLFTREGLPDLV